MTIFGPDVSSYQGGINIAALNTPFVLLKCTEGTYYADAYYDRWLAQARAAGMIAVPYHFITGETPAAQAAHLLAHIADKSLPVMLDWEPEGSYSPPLSQLLAVADAVNAAGMRTRLAYAPHWHWANIGSPSLSGLTGRGIGLVSSAYPGGSGYPGDGAAGWLPYGGVTPTLYQFTDVAVEGGQTVGDRNAYRGTIDQFAAFLGTAAPSSPTPQGGAMPNIPPSISQKWPDIAGDFPPNAPYTDDTALIWSDAGSRAAALYAREARDAVNALAAKIGQPPVIDVNALAAAIAPHLTTGATADVIAAAVLHHLSADTANG